MAEFALKILNIVLLPFHLVDSPLVLVPLSFCTVSAVFLLFARMMRKR